MYVYMLVTRDEYELPLVIADSRKELAEKLNVPPELISSAISHAKRRGGRSQYQKVEI